MTSKIEKEDIARGVLCRINTQLTILSSKVQNAIEKRNLSQLISALISKHATISASLEIWDMNEVVTAGIENLFPSC